MQEKLIEVKSSLLKLVKTLREDSLVTKLWLVHSTYFTLLVLIGALFFSSPLFVHNLWGTYWNDSWRYLANTLELGTYPYPFHLIATSLHYWVIYQPTSLLLPSDVALTFAVLLVNYLASLVGLVLWGRILVEVFDLPPKVALLTTLTYDFALLSSFLLLAHSDVLFFLYQTMAWFCFHKRRFWPTSFFTAMTFATRFTGAFFVLGMVILFSLYWWTGNRELSPKIVVQTLVAGLLMFVVGFCSFLYSLLRHGDFWLPLTSQHSIYLQYTYHVGTEKPASTFTAPFVWWVDYFEWVRRTSDVFYTAQFILGILVLIGSIGSILWLVHYSQKRKENKKALELLILCTTSQTALTMLSSGTNFVRFASFSFPFVPLLIFVSDKLFRSGRTRMVYLVPLSAIVFGLVGLFATLAIVEPCPSCVASP